MKTHSEASLNPDVLASLKGSIEEGAGIVGVSSEDDPGVIVEAIDSFVFAWQGGEQPLKGGIDPKDAPYALGSLWGEQFVRRFEWEWRMIIFQEHAGAQALGVLSRDRTLVVYPIHFIFGCLRDPGVDATIMLSYNMLKAGKVGGLTPGQYMNLMDGVHRIVPRIPDPPSKP